jgi:hypothetical protein
MFFSLGGKVEEEKGKMGKGKRGEVGSRIPPRFIFIYIK